MPDYPDLCDLLKPFSTCDISDALVKLGVPHGGCIPDIRAFSPREEEAPDMKVIGPAFTVEMVHASTAGGEKPKGHHIDLAAAGDVMVITSPPDCVNAVWGGLMSAGARSRGLKGVIINGRCRDIAEHRRLGFPVFAIGQSTLGQGSFTRVASVNTPIAIDTAAGRKVVINPGDIIVADWDGVVVISPHMIEKAVSLMSISCAQDQKCMEDLIRGQGVEETFKKHRSH
ncbi:hypothetical protein NliqN6_1014 [Naganishia liquefaciens]|uniref:RraA family protein n=1 Tax=Naganishia liquefaciens TaxID=104408 RepID=A0A8H3YDU3_9TREE|nr:hypothetical protein NliqN6_1014 [Naganishia liquefaciens]